MHSEKVKFDTPTMSGIVEIKGSKAIPYVASMGADLNSLTPPLTHWTTVIFVTLKDNSLEINSSAMNNCFSYRNVFQKWRQCCVKNGKAQDFV